MTRVRRSQRLRRHLEAVRNFDAKLDDLEVVLARRPQLSQWDTQGREQLWQDIEVVAVELDRLSAPASRAADEMGWGIRIIGPPALGAPQQVVNGFLSWRSVLATSTAMFDFDLSDLRPWVRQLDGLLEIEIDKQERIERTLAGKVAAFLAFPGRVREAMGLQSGTTPGRFAWGLVAFIQGVLVAGVGAVVGILLAQLLGIDANSGAPASPSP